MAIGRKQEHGRAKVVRDVPTAFRLTPTQHELLDELAGKRGTTRSSLLRQLVDEELARAAKRGEVAKAS